MDQASVGMGVWEVIFWQEMMVACIRMAAVNPEK